MKIAFVIQRYGEDISGGAEYHCRLLAEHLSKETRKNNLSNLIHTKSHKIEVITTCAKEYSTWKNEYKPGIQYINGVLVRRFKNDFERTKKFHELYIRILGGIAPDKFKDNYDYIIANIKKTPISEQMECIRLQGPYSSDLLNYLKLNNHSYDCFIFFTYMYPTTVFGIRNVPPGKVLLVPTVHDEPLLYFEIFKEIFNKPVGIIYNTEEEKELVNSKLGIENIASEIIGIGIEVPTNVNSNYFINKYKIYHDYIIYVGRIDEVKGCKKLFDNFIVYKKRKHSDIKLVLIGKQEMEITNHHDIIHVGFISEKDKFNGIKGSKVLIMPSEFESLSMVTLEAWLLGIPALVNGYCNVLKGHCIKSNAGLYYTNYDEFEACLDLLLSDKLMRSKMGENGRRYVGENYSWDVVERKYLKLLNEI